MPTKTDNSHFEHKVKIRLDNLPSSKEISVLDCFHGDGKIWSEIKRRANIQINVVGIDKKNNKNGAMVGDNIKVMRSIDLNKFDVIDLDAYGSPFKQLFVLFEKKYKGTVYFTSIQTMQGNLPLGLLTSLGFTKKMIQKCPTLFSRNGFEKLKKYLSMNGVTFIKHYSFGRKHYGCFSIL